MQSESVVTQPRETGSCYLETQFRIPFLKPDFICVCDGSLAQTSASDGGAQARLWPAVIAPCPAVMRFDRKKRKRDGGEGLTSAINLDAWVEDSNPQIGSVFVDPVLRKKRGRRRGRRGHLGSISTVIVSERDNTAAHRKRFSKT